MSKTMKKILVIVATVLALGAAIFSVVHTMQSGQPHDEGPLGGKAADPNAPPGKRTMGGG